MRHPILLLIAFSAFSLFGQKEKNWGIEYRQKIGFFTAHHLSMAHLPNKLVNAGELTFFIKPNGSKQWHEDYNKPLLGISGYVGSAGNRDVLGMYYGIYQFIEFHFVRKKHYSLNWKMGNGIGYATKKYDPITNPKNSPIGSHFNALICLGLTHRWNFKNHDLTFSIDLTHFSNAASQTPNLGINLPFAGISYGYSFNQSESLPTTSPLPYSSPFKKRFYGITTIFSAKEIYPTGGRKYPVFALSLFSRYISKPKVGYEISLDFFSKQSIMGYKTDLNKNQWDILQIGAFAGYILPLDKFHFVLGMGIYLKDKYQPDTFLYHRVGMRYFLNNGLSFNVVLKSHWASADYFESGFGYTFNYKSK